MPHIFISYAKKDTQELAFALDDALNALDDVTSWVDRSIKAGQNWDSMIQREIRGCDYLIVLYSPDMNRHLDDEKVTESFVIKEMKYAKQQGKMIIPIMVKSTGLPIDFINIQYIDYIGEGMNLNQLVEKIMDSMPTLHTSVLSPQKFITFSGKSSLDLLPQPFAWINIPAGIITLSDRKQRGYLLKDMQFSLNSFLISKYPLTNAQFRLFIEAGGYKSQNWWTESGLKARQEGLWEYPAYWNTPRFNDDTQPVIGISWYEAIAYCKWLSEITGENIMIPNEQQWQWSAQGNDNRIYPWGDIWHKNYCNNGQLGLRKTTPVTQFEGKGDSPFGVVDMVGNMWEWCLNHWDLGMTDLDDNGVRVLRGGSYGSDNSLTNVQARTKYLPKNRGATRDCWGFRLVRLDS